MKIIYSLIVVQLIKSETKKLGAFKILCQLKNSDIEHAV